MNKPRDKKSGKFITKYTDEELIQMGRERNPNVEVVNISKDKNSIWTFRCHKCGGEYNKQRQYLTSGKGSFNCPFCSGHLVQEGINDICTTANWMCQYFVDKDFPKHHTFCSTVKTLVECPNCKTRKLFSPCDLQRCKGIGCKVCSDGISFPNKYIRAFLKQLPITKVKYEFCPEWGNRKLYDNYFEYDDQAYIVEADGYFHYAENLMNGGRSLKESQRIDRAKEKVASEHGVKTIRIDCLKSDGEYIKNSILKSELNDIFCLSEINWESCLEATATSLILSVWEYYKTHNHPTLAEIGSVFHISTNTAMRYLKRGDESGAIHYYRSYNKKNIIRRNAIVMSIYDKQMIHLGDFESISTGVNYLNSKYDLCFSQKYVYKLCKTKGDGDMIKYKNVYIKFRKAGDGGVG